MKRTGRRHFLPRLLAVLAASLSGVTCDLVTSPSADSGITVEYDGPTRVVVGTLVPFAPEVLEHGVPLEGARLSVVSSDSSIVAVRDLDGGFSFALDIRRRGQAIIQASFVSSTLIDAPPSTQVVFTAVAAKLLIDSTAVTFHSFQDTVTLKATALDGQDEIIPGAVTATRWRSTDATVATVDSISGKVTARANGAAQVIALLDSNVADTTAVTVEQQLVAYGFAPISMVLASIGLDTVFVATPLDARGNAITAGVTVPTPVFATLNAGVATVSSTGSTGRIRTTGNGNSGIRVTGPGTIADDTIAVTVGQVATTVAIAGATTQTIEALQDTLLLLGTAVDAIGTEIRNRTITWFSRNSAIAQVDPASGRVRGVGLGATRVLAQMDAATDSVDIVVLDIPRSVRTTPSVLLPTVGDQVVLLDTAFNRLGNPVPGTSVAWRSLDTTIAVVDAAGQVTARSIGTTLVVGEIAGGYADSTQVAVENRVAAVDITLPDTALASIGDTVTVRASITNARGALLPLASATWLSSDTSVLKVANGFLTASRAGFATIAAVDPLNSARFDTVRVTVTNAPASVTLNRVSDTLTALTTTLQYTAVVRNARGAIITDPSLTWRSANASVASVTPDGLVTALAVGTTAVVAEASGGGVVRTASADLIVRNDAVTLTVSPTDFTIPSVGATLQLGADARNVVGGAVTGVSFLWSSSDPSVATVSGSGLVTGVSVGTAQITARLQALSAIANATVTNAPDTINIIPASLTLASVDDTVIPGVVLRNALGATLARDAAQWTSDNGEFARVTGDGRIIATGRGTTYVRAVNALNPARRDSVFVDVTNAPAAIDVLRSVDSLPSLGRTLTYTANLFNARGAAILDQAVSWTSRSPSVATISATTITTGVATSVGIGQTYIVASAGTVRDSALLIVSNRAASVDITPAAAALGALGDTVRLTAIARNELGNVISGATISWSSANTSVATVSATGLVTAVGTGSTTVSAEVDGIGNSIGVSVSNAPTTVLITSGNLTLASVGDQVTPSVDFRNALGTVLARDAVLWTTSDVNVATVSGTGVVTAAGRGTATITATSPLDATKASSITVTVTDAPASLTITPAGPETITAIGSAVTFVAVVRNAAGNVIADPVPAVTWSRGVSDVAVTIGAASGVATAVAPGTATITATAGVATGSVTVTVAPAAAGSASVIASTATQLTADGASTATITVQLKDANGNNLTTSGGTVTLSLAGTGSLGAVTDHGNGTYSATLTAPTAIGTGTVSGAINGAAITTGDPQVRYVAGTATKYVVSSNNSSPVAGTPVTVSAQLADAFNNPVEAARTVTWSSTGGGAFGAPTSNTNASGVATVSYTTSSVAQTVHTLTANDGSVSGTSGVVQTIAGAPATYLVTASNATPAAGGNVTITAQLADANDNAVGQGGRTVNWSVGGAGGSLSSPSSGTNGSGVASVVLTVGVPGTVHTVTATDNASGAITGTSDAITVGGQATQYLVTSSNSAPEAGTTVTITAQLADAGSTPVALAGQTVNWSKTGTGGSFASAFSITNSNGVAAVAFTTNTSSGTTHTVTATDNLGLTGTSSNIVTAAGPPTKLTFTAQPPDPSVVGIGFATTVTAQDVNDNTATGFNGSVAIAIGANPSGGTLGGTTTVAAVNGVATFSGLTIDKAGLNYTLTATTTTPALTRTSAQFDVNNPDPTLTGLAPNAGARLDTVAIVFTGTGFLAGVTTVNAPTGFTVDSVRVTSPTLLTAYARISSTATTGARNFSVANPAPGGGSSGTQTFTVSNPLPTLTAATPNTGDRLQANLDVVLSGTKFITGVSTASFGAGITVNSTTVNSSTQITANITITAGAVTGSRDITVTNAAPGGGVATLTNGFTVENPPPTVTSASPSSAVQGQEGLNVVLTGTKFLAGTTSVTFENPGITVNSTSVTSSTSLTVNVSVADGAATGAGDITVTNGIPGGGSATLTDGFTINAPPAPTLSSIGPTSGDRLETLDVVFTGTNFVSGVSTVDVGSDITVNSLTVNSSTELTANITIAATAATGVRTFSVTNTPTGGTSATRDFTVNNPDPTLASVSPNAGNRLQTLDVVFTGTGFIQNVTQVNAGTGITVNSVTVASATQLTANITIASTASTGARNFSVTNPAPGGGSSENRTFTVSNPLPTLTAIAPATGERLQTLDVVFTGTGFIAGVSSVNVGSGITVNSTTVDNPTQITANVTITAAAATGARNFTVTNAGPGGGTTTAQSFSVTNPAPTLAGASVTSAYQGQTGVSIELTGTNFISGATSVAFENPDIAVTGTTVNSATLVTVTISVAAGATTGAGDITVTNAAPGGGTATLTDGFTVDAPPAPTLTGISPSSGDRLQTLDVVFTGTGFITGVSAVNVGSGITVNSTTVNSETQLTANITIGAGAATGDRDFTVTNTPGGTTAAQTFTVNNPDPTLASLSPNSGNRLQTLDVVFTGTGFIDGVTTVTVPTTGFTVNSVTLNSATQLTANITIADTVTTGARNFSVTNSGPGGGSSETRTFTVNNPAPTLTTVEPDTVAQGVTGFDIVLTGTNFIDGVSTVSISSTNGLSVVSTTVNSPTQITWRITLTGGANTGNRTITVVNAGPGGGTSSGRTLTIINN